MVLLESPELFEAAWLGSNMPEPSDDAKEIQPQGVKPLKHFTPIKAPSLAILRLWTEVALHPRGGWPCRVVGFRGCQGGLLKGVSSQVSFVGRTGRVAIRCAIGLKAYWASGVGLWVLGCEVCFEAIWICMVWGSRSLRDGDVLIDPSTGLG